MSSPLWSWCPFKGLKMGVRDRGRTTIFLKTKEHHPPNLSCMFPKTFLMERDKPAVISLMLSEIRQKLVKSWACP